MVLVVSASIGSEKAAGRHKGKQEPAPCRISTKRSTLSSTLFAEHDRLTYRRKESARRYIDLESRRRSRPMV